MAPSPVVHTQAPYVRWSTGKTYDALEQRILKGRRMRLRRRMVTVALIAFFSVWIWFTYGHLAMTTLIPIPPVQPTPRLMVASMLFGETTSYYERALETHLRHCTRWGYSMHILRRNFSGGYWNKPYYILSLVIQELAKPPEQRTDWLMWVDADTIILNSAVPSDIFLPPRDLEDIHFIASKDSNGLNTGVIFVHIHPWSVGMLTEALAFPKFFPEIDLGVSADQESMARIMSSDGGEPPGTNYKDGVIYFPRTWFNAYELSHGYEGQKGSLLVHFPGMGADRWPHMAKWLDAVETHPHEWEVALNQTTYANDTHDFWKMLREAKN